MRAPSLRLRSVTSGPHLPVAPAARVAVIGAGALRLGVAAAFAIDAYVHATNASIYDPASSAIITEGNLFRVEAVVAGLMSVLILLRPRRFIWIAAVLVAASALGAVVLYRYVDVGSLGPIPDLYEPTWQVPGKLLSAYAEGAALVLSGLGTVLPLIRHAGDADGRAIDRHVWSGG
jgi:hypothetical protein